MPIKNVVQAFAQLKGANGKRKDLLKIMIENASVPGFLTVLRGAFHPKIKYVFTDGIPPYTPALKETPDLGFTTIPNELKRVYIFEEGHPSVPKNLSLERKKVLLVQILEAMDRPDAEIFANMLAKDLKIPGLTKKLVEETWPSLLT